MKYRDLLATTGVCLLAPACVAPADASSEGVEVAREPTVPRETGCVNLVSERTGEAEEPATSDECWAGYKAGEAVCQVMPPDAAMGCFLTIKAILVVCLASAR